MRPRMIDVRTVHEAIGPGGRIRTIQHRNKFDSLPEDQNRLLPTRRLIAIYPISLCRPVSEPKL